MKAAPHLSVVPHLASFDVSLAGNPPCPVCVGSGMVRVRFRGTDRDGDLTWDACWLCAQRAEAEYQVEETPR